MPVPHPSRKPAVAGHRPTIAARFAHASDGVSAVEFAMILPIMILIVVCLAELAHAVDNYRKVTLLARTVSDLTSQGDKVDPISTDLMTDIIASSALVLRPFDSSSVKIVVSAMGVYSTSAGTKPKVCSSYANANATVRAIGTASDLTVPAGYLTPGIRYVLTEVSVPYVPMLGSRLAYYLGATNGAFTFAVNTPWPSRGGNVQNSTYTEVRLPKGAACPLT